jgi:hypothetical protein
MQLDGEFEMDLVAGRSMLQRKVNSGKCAANVVAGEPNTRILRLHMAIGACSAARLPSFLIQRIQFNP